MKTSNPQVYQTPVKGPTATRGCSSEQHTQNTSIVPEVLLDGTEPGYFDPSTCQQAPSGIPAPSTSTSSTTAVDAYKASLGAGVARSVYPHSPVSSSKLPTH